MALVWAHCKSKTTFEPDERQQAVAAVTNGPLSSKMKIFVQSKGSKDDDDPDKRLVTPSEIPTKIYIFSVFLMIWVDRRAALKDGHYVFSNQQPSLHNMMSHRVRLMPYSRSPNFRFNLSVIPYNADFDGDEMNMHVIASQKACYRNCPGYLASFESSQYLNVSLIVETSYTGRRIGTAPGSPKLHGPILRMTTPRGINLERKSDSKKQILSLTTKIAGASADGLQGAPRLPRERFQRYKSTFHWVGRQLLVLAQEHRLTHLGSQIEGGRFIDDPAMDRLKTKPSMTLRDSFKREVESLLNKAREGSGQNAQKHLKECQGVVYYVGTDDTSLELQGSTRSTPTSKSIAVCFESQDNAMLMFRMHLRVTSAALNALEEYHREEEAFEWDMAEVETKLNQSVLHPIEMCSSACSQSINEPATQMALHVVHYAGASSKAVTFGGRASRKSSTLQPYRNSLTIHLDPEIAGAGLTENVQQEPVYTSLRTVTSSVAIWYDPTPKPPSSTRAN
ncbi:hypothetical protein BKA70DRAFT_1446351 [Coprinopsis sp. MPI-PUGE-AT-0042]|nr:hypothetical protein BKA70DRAFT_1446351 [Coprinopsis sp. MPI-PUGE-AT-0042]